MAALIPVRVPDLKRIVKATQDMGLPITKIEIGPDGSIRIETKETRGDSADAALDSWIRRNG